VHKLFPIAHILGLTLMLFSLAYLPPIWTAAYYADGTLLDFIESMAISFSIGLVLWLGTRRFKRELKPRDGFALVVLLWTGMAAVATFPLLKTIPGLSFTDAYFETISGITTTGSTVLSGLDTLPPALNLWRGELVWLGGMGLIVLAVAILPLLGVGGMQIYKAETPGPMKDAKLTPRITETAKGLWLVYFGITVACGLAYWAAGMTPFDAVMHAFTTMGLGGFSSHDASFGYFNSPLIEFITIVFMLVAGANFATHFLALRRFTLTPYREDPEARWFWLVTLVSCVGLALFLWLHQVYPDYLTALRYAAFNTVSIATSTGFANTDYNLWPIFAPLMMLFLSSFASSSGSTGGGIKMIRAQLLIMQSLREFSRLIHPRAMLPVKIGHNVVSNQVIYAVLAFFFLYISNLSLLTIILTASGLDIVTAFSAVVASINNTGPGLNQVGPATTYAVLTDFQTWVCTYAMLIGRLELFTFLVLLTPGFWKK
jgi:trk system potassium uptake protein TrkH